MSNAQAQTWWVAKFTKNCQIKKSFYHPDSCFSNNYYNDILTAISTHDITKEVTRNFEESSTKDSLKVNTISMPIQTFKDVEFKL